MRSSTRCPFDFLPALVALGWTATSFSGNVSVHLVSMMHCMYSKCRDVQRRRGTVSHSTKRETAQVTLNTGSNCKLAVAFYPIFSYDASNGAVSGVKTQGEQGRTLLTFDPEQTYIPPLDWRTTRVLGLPIPPPLRIEITTRELSVRASDCAGSVVASCFAHDHHCPILRRL
jgi:hypothetical protein